VSKLGLSSIEDDTVGKNMDSGLLFDSQRNGLGSALVDDTYDVDNILKLVLSFDGESNFGVWRD